MKLEGAMTALVTPMRGEHVDYDALTLLIEEQLAAGIDGLVARGHHGRVRDPRRARAHCRWSATWSG